MAHTEEFRCISLCAGYAGIELGLERCIPNLRTVVYVEREAFAVANLVSKMEAGLLAPAPVWTDIKTFDGKPFRKKVDIITAGFPCQPFSVAGKRGGSADERHLWPHIERIIEAVRPVFVFLENVPGLLSARSLDNRPDLCRYLARMGKATEKMPAKGRWYLGEHLRRLEQYWLRTEGFPAYAAIYFSLRDLGYEVEAGLFTAAECGAPHKRERLFILAYNENGGFTGSNLSIRQSQRQKQTKINSVRIGKMADTEHPESRSGTVKETQTEIGRDRFAIGNADMADSNGPGCEEQCRGESVRQEYQAVECGGTKWPARPGQPQYEWEEPRVVGDSRKQKPARLSSSERQTISEVGEASEMVDSGCGRCKQSTKKLQARRNTAQQTDQGQAQSRLGVSIARVACGMGKPGSRVDELGLLGNGVVPQQAEKAFKYLMAKFEVS